MPKFYAIGVNVIGATAFFNNTKTVTVYFAKVFDKPPRVLITPLDSGQLPLYKQSEFTDRVVIRCKQAWSGQAELQIMERA